MSTEIIYCFYGTVFGLAYINNQNKIIPEEYKIAIRSELPCYNYIHRYHIIHILLKVQNKSEIIINYQTIQISKVKDWNREKSSKVRVGTETKRVRDRSSSQLKFPFICLQLLAISPHKTEL